MGTPLCRLVIALGTACLASIAAPRLASACGGCFSPPPGTDVTMGTVVQDAERVLFLRDAKTKRSVVWVEVRYTGNA